MKVIKDKELESKEILLRAEKETARQSRKISELEIMTLRSQINPHFIFNALNSIQENILANRNHQAIQYLGNFSGLLRKTLENADKKFIVLADEANALELYLKIESSRFGFTWTIVIDPALDVFSVEVPPMIVQPFVENAIWHGLMHKSEPGALKVQFTRNEAQLICVVEDNGVGRSFMNGKQNPLKKDYKSKGNTLVSGRLEALNALHKLNARLDIRDLVDHEGNACGTRVEVSMDLLAG